MKARFITVGEPSFVDGLHKDTGLLSETYEDHPELSSK